MRHIYIPVHRIGRTGRCGKTGLATTFVNKGVDETVLLDLKHLLIEAKQKVPPFLLSIQPDNERLLDIGGRLLKPVLYSILGLYPSTVLNSLTDFKKFSFVQFNSILQMTNQM